MADLSKLSNEDLLALRSGNITAVSDAGLLSLAGTPKQPSKKPSFKEALGKAAEQVSRQGVVTTIGSTVEKGLRKAFDIGGETLAETLAGPGLTARSIFPGGPVVPAPAQQGDLSLKTSPETAAAIGTGVSILPDIAEATLLGGGAKVAGKAAAKRFTSKELGKAIGQLEQAAGIEKLAPTVERVGASLGLPKNAKFNDLVNAIVTIKKQGGNLAGQVAADFKRLADDLTKLGKIPRQKTATSALINEADKFATQQLNRAVAGRAEKAAQFGGARRREQLLESLLGGTRRTAGQAAKLGAIGAGGGGAAFALSKLFGG